MVENFSFDDELLDDEFGDGATDDDAVGRRQQAFQADVDKHIRIIRSPKRFDAKTRKESVYWLGESGDPQAIDPLILVYQKDKSPGMKQAAAYALGMFRALDEALNDPDESVADDAYARLDAIVLEGEMGQRSSIRRRPLIMAIVGLIISFAALMGIGVMASSGPDTPPDEDVDLMLPTVDPLAGEIVVVPTATPITPESVTEDLQTYYTQLSDDARLLLSQFNTITAGNSIDCEAEFADPDAYVIPEDFDIDSSPALVDFTDALNAIDDQLDEFYGYFRESCTSQQPIRQTDALRYADSIIAIQQELASINETLGAEVGSDTQPLLPTRTPTPTEAPPTNTPEPVTPTPNSRLVTMHRFAVQGLIDDMSGLRGANTLLMQYWRDVQSEGSTFACALPPEIVPEDYILSEDDAGQVPPEIVQAVENINLGLGLTRNSWDAFTAACASETLTEQVTTQLQLVELADQAYQEAQSLLDSLR